MLALSTIKDREGKAVRPAFRNQAMDEVLLLVDRAEITDEDGKFSGIEKALGTLAKAKPYLLAEEPAPKKGTPVAGAPRPQQAAGNEPPRPRILGSL